MRQQIQRPEHRARRGLEAGPHHGGDLVANFRRLSAGPPSGSRAASSRIHEIARAVRAVGTRQGDAGGDQGVDFGEPATADVGTGAAEHCEVALAAGQHVPDRRPARSHHELAHERRQTLGAGGARRQREQGAAGGIQAVSCSSAARLARPPSQARSNVSAAALKCGISRLTLCGVNGGATMRRWRRQASPSAMSTPRPRPGRNWRRTITGRL